ncbi:hypothetical protein HYZ05_02990 [Candidatus Daviesbacteria bacterium]|nr:hypothetical protein [Candidatus Daviesbacteria bacterium]
MQSRSYLRKLVNINIFLFIILFFVVFWMQYDLLKPTLEIGLTPDDWSFIFWYKLLGLNPLSKISQVWAVSGPYTTVPMYYTGIIQSFVGFNYQALQIVSISFKVLATLIIFPLVAVVFKNKFLAFLATIFFAMSYPSTGALETAVEPSEYLGMFSMGIFLIVYYLVIKKNLSDLKWLSLTLLLFITTILLSIMRLYPLFVLIPLIEIYLWIQKPSKASLGNSLLRLAVLFSPFILITLYRPSVILNYIGTVPAVLVKVLEGNWHLSLVPLQGLGYTLPFSANWGLLGVLNIDSFNEYLSFILGGPLVIFGLIIMFLAFSTSNNPWRFFILSITLNIFFEILIYFIATHYLSIPMEQRLNFDTPRIYPTIVGLLILVLAFVYWIEWKNREKKNNLLLALWAGLAVALLFIVLTWILASISLGFGGAQDHYLLIPSAGISIFLAAIVILIYQRIRKIKMRFLKIIAGMLIVVIISSFYFLNRNLIYSYFNHVNANGRAALGQIMIQSAFRNKTENLDLSKPALFYFDTSELSGDGPFYTEGLLSPLPFFMHFQGDKLVDGCFEVFYDTKNKLAELVEERNGEKGFIYRSLCVENGKGSYKEIFHRAENFYAYKLKNKDFIDIKKEMLKQLGF